MLSALLDQLRARQDLAPAEAAAAARALAQAEVPVADKVAFLAALHDKGETPAELAEFARTYRTLARDPGLGAAADAAIDLVGTGGDHAGGFNVSTLATFTAACLGVTVCKHGNRGITSKCGSADLMAALGVDLEAPPEKVRAAVDALGFCFLFAPAYHPAFRQVAPARQALAAEGRRSIFNLLGPLLNPARPAHVVLGVATPALRGKFVSALGALGIRGGLVVHGERPEGGGIDELTTATRNSAAGVGALAAFAGGWQAEDFGLAPAPFADLVGGDVAANVALTEALVAGRGPRGLEDTIVLNAAVAAWVVGRAPDVRAAIPAARAALVGGAVAKRIAATREFYRS